MTHKQKRRPVEGGAVLLGGVNCAHTTENGPAPQPANTCQLQALHLITTRRVRPELALMLAGFVFGEAR